MSAHDRAVEAAEWARSHSRSTSTATLIAAYLAHMAAAGWKLTPREATEVMRAAMTRLNHPHDHELWEAAHDAAPSPEEAHER